MVCTSKTHIRSTMLSSSMFPGSANCPEEIQRRCELLLRMKDSVDPGLWVRVEEVKFATLSSIVGLLFSQYSETSAAMNSG